MSESHICPCCGFAGLNRPAYRNIEEAPLRKPTEPPYSRYYGEPSYEVCDCCGYEFGNDDEPGTGQATSFEDYLANWIKHGCNWFKPIAKGTPWDLEQQVATVGRRIDVRVSSLQTPEK
jgi:hypothetical protein